MSPFRPMPAFAPCVGPRSHGHPVSDGPDAADAWRTLTSNLPCNERPDGTPIDCRTVRFPADSRSPRRTGWRGFPASDPSPRERPSRQVVRRRGSMLPRVTRPRVGSGLIGPRGVPVVAGVRIRRPSIVNRVDVRSATRGSVRPQSHGCSAAASPSNRFRPCSVEEVREFMGWFCRYRSNPVVHVAGTGRP